MRTTTDAGRRTLPRTRAVFVLTVLLVIGAIGVLLVVSGWHTRDQERPVASWVTTTGRVVDVHSEPTRTGHIYEPVVSFTDTAGRMFRFDAPKGSQQPDIGEVARVSYDPSDPTRAHDLSASSSTWTGPFVTGVGVLTVDLVALAVVLGAMRRRRAAQVDVDGGSSSR